MLTNQTQYKESWKRTYDAVADIERQLRATSDERKKIRWEEKLSIKKEIKDNMLAQMWVDYAECTQTHEEWLRGTMGEAAAKADKACIDITIGIDDVQRGLAKIQKGQCEMQSAAADLRQVSVDTCQVAIGLGGDSNVWGSPQDHALKKELESRMPLASVCDDWAKPRSYLVEAARLVNGFHYHKHLQDMLRCGAGAETQVAVHMVGTNDAKTHQRVSLGYKAVESEMRHIYTTCASHLKRLQRVVFVEPYKTLHTFSGPTNS